MGEETCKSYYVSSPCHGHHGCCYFIIQFFVLELYPENAIGSIALDGPYVRRCICDLIRPLEITLPWMGHTHVDAFMILYSYARLLEITSLSKSEGVIAPYSPS